ncbi:serine/threonine-protein kinase-like protein CCR1 [Andrographis paniculata]|uniref:serine/threonine-protein kinase-like protein CCR1 n=1 Tax=Andrographis paniculata TaxID=175694 RepID=UPI0021E7CDAF|nr:serine/threonine-protein kinase-like protein CCR1 [Andrographis paniculata]
MKLPLRFIHGPLSNPAFYSAPLLLLLILAGTASGFGSMGPIAASFGDYALFCAIDASGKQAVICWDANNSSSTASSLLHYSSVLPPMAAISGGEGFLCGILVNTSQLLCWDSMGTAKTSDLIPQVFKTNTYSHVAAGKDHVCAIQGLYYSNDNSGDVHCWDIVRVSNTSLTSAQSPRFYDQNVNLKKLVSGDGFACGINREGALSCWGPNSGDLGIAGVSENFSILASGLDSLCGVSQTSGEIKCWGNSSSYANPPVGIRFVSLASGARHFCGIREDDHGIQCWGNFNDSLIPKGPGFLAIASSNFLTCGIRESDLVLDCWFTNLSARLDYDPPLQLCSPGLCTAGPCREGMFAFNASLLNEPDLTSLCVRKELSICSPCGLNCSEGFFASSPCTSYADRVCTPCSLCQNSSCWDVCRLQSSPGMQKKHWDQFRQLLLIVGSSASGFVLILFAWCLLPRVMIIKNEEGKKQFLPCMRKADPESDGNLDQHPPASVAPACPGVAQVFRLSELKDATNGFKEFNELGRGSYGFVYKAVLPDGRQVAVKRANAATIIQSNSRDFEMELEVLCNLRHANIVNLLGYCAEMGERLLVYEYMPHGNLHDHLHGGLSSLNWSLRLKIAMQAAKGLEYLHNEAAPPIVHCNIRSSKILLDADWAARIADFRLLTPSERDVNAEMRRDVYGFGIVLLEILSGRKSYDADCVPPDIVDWALPQIRQGRAAAIIDRYIALPRNVEPLLKLADIAELALREDGDGRGSMADLAVALEQLVKDGLIL